MSKAYRINDQQGLYFVTMVVVYWIDLFICDHSRQNIINTLDRCRKQKGLSIWACVIMTNHIHLIASVQTPLSDIIRDFKLRTTKHL